MTKKPDRDVVPDYRISPAAYEWCARLFNSLRRSLGINIRLHAEPGRLEEAEILLFNHFARFETFIPQYLMYQELGVYSRSVAAAQFFRGNTRMGSLLKNLGAVPNEMPGLLPFLAAEILRGRKVVIFPEGGMVKDRQVIDDSGRFSIYSRRAHVRRKHHSGAAVLATGLAIYRARLCAAEADGDDAFIDEQVRRLRFDSREALMAAAHRPTVLVPANITFYPLRADDNVMRRLADHFTGGLGPRAVEELIIESNLLLRHTDMDIRLGEALHPQAQWGWLDRQVARRMTDLADHLEDYFALKAFSDNRIISRMYNLGMRRGVNRLRDAYMRDMYRGVTINLSHLASRIILDLISDGHDGIAEDAFHRMLYLAVKRIQGERGVHLHRSLRNPDAYIDLPDGRCEGLDQFLGSAERAGLIDRHEGRYRFLDKLRFEPEFDQIRVQNPIAVYANEAAPLLGFERSVDEAIVGEPRLGLRDIADLRFEDEQRSLAWDREQFSKARHATINDEQTATEDPAPFRHIVRGERCGVLLLHGFLASPAEVRPFADELVARELSVLAPRLKGHGTSPWDLRERNWSDWLDSVRRGYEMLAPFCDHVVMVGFSTGGVLALLHAATRPARLAGVAAIAAPMKFANRNMIFVPLVDGANRLIRSVSTSDGIMPFRRNESEHPHINYRHVPLQGLNELRLVVNRLREQLDQVHCPVRILQGTGDRIVDPVSARLLHDGLVNAASREMTMIDSARHGILYQDIGPTRHELHRFIETLRHG